MDNLTHSLAGALLGQMGLKRSSRLAMAGCILGANAPDIDVFAPLLFEVDNIAFHRGPTHAVWGWPVMAAGVVALLWLYDRLVPGNEGTPPFRPVPLFVAVFLAVLTHPFLDWLTTYAVALFAPVGSRWYSANAIFIIDWVYWLILITGILWSARSYRRHLPQPGRPAQAMGLILLAYIIVNVAWSSHAERTMAAALRERSIEPVLIVPSPPPFLFWNRTMAWRSKAEWGSGSFSPAAGLRLHSMRQPLRLDDPRLTRARQSTRAVRSFLYWSRMPIVVEEGGRAYLTDQRYYRAFDTDSVPDAIRNRAPRGGFMVALDP
ncbi:MAG TPA: metal-dependent hydrolase [Sphingomicrobium sp.]|jgi:inner membrane protein|nr:metal-dependent hydrolase [Sphingomicrobium sp.]